MEVILGVSQVCECVWRAETEEQVARENGSRFHAPLGAGNTRAESLYLVQRRHFSKADDTLEKKPNGQGLQIVSETPVAGREEEALIITVDHLSGS